MVVAVVVAVVEVEGEVVRRGWGRGVAMMVEPFAASDWVPTGGKRPGGVIELWSRLLDTTVWVASERVLSFPMARRTDPGTAHEAARKVSARAASDEALVLRAHEDAGSAGLTGDELAAATGRGYSQIGPRRKELERRGLVAPLVGVRRANCRGNQEQVYVATAAQSLEGV